MNSDNSVQNNMEDFDDSLNDFIWSVTYRYPDGEKILYSDSLYSITGYSQEEIESLPGKFVSLIAEDDLELFKSTMAELENNPSKKSSQIIYRILSKQGQIIWLKEKIKVTRDLAGIIIKLNKIALDITDFKKRELELLTTSEKLQETNASKDKFISIVSHDLRSPFTTLLGFSEILVNEPSLSRDEQIEYLDYIHEASKTQLQMINNLLDWSRLQTGRVKVDPVRINLKTMVSHCVSAYTGEAVRKNIEVSLDIDSKYFIKADERYIEIAILNLISNAVKFSNEGSLIEISANDFSKNDIEIIVKDEGIGIPEEQHHKLFKIDEKFVREGTKGEKGTGLGLTLVNEIIDKHKGKIWFYSKVDEGSEFHLLLEEAKNVLLLIEDDKVTRKLYKKKIAESFPNYIIVESDNGYDAIKLLNNVSPSIIVTDHDMPLMNGIQFIEAIRNREAYIPVIVISAIFNEEIKLKYEKLGVRDLINKPFDYGELVSIISRNF
jgi:two-component system, sensor histidine kinase and response regulator